MSHYPRLIASYMCTDREKVDVRRGFSPQGTDVKTIAYDLAFG